jgi:hypothetical protein
MSFEVPTEASFPGLSPPPWNTGEFLSTVHIPEGWRYQRGTAAAVPEWGGTGGKEQVQTLGDLPAEYYSPGVRAWLRGK